MTDLSDLSKELSEFSLICVTGKMAAGKNFICSHLEQYGWASVDADTLVHKAIEIASEKIKSAFEPYAKEKNIKIILEDGSINRKALGELLFSSPRLLKIQESIVYPVITSMLEDFIKSHEKTIINATVLYKTPDFLNQCEAVVFVTAPFFTRLKRAEQRDGIPRKQILKRFYNQKNLLKKYQKLNKPIYIVNNS